MGLWGDPCSPGGGGDCRKGPGNPPTKEAAAGEALHNPVPRAGRKPPSVSKHYGSQGSCR